MAELSCCNWEPEKGYDLAKKALKAVKPRTILCLNDRLAFGTYQAIADAGLSVPASACRAM